MPTWLVLQHRLDSFFYRCLLDWAYDPQAAKSGSHPFFIHRCLLDWAYDPQAAKNGSHPLFFIGAYLIGLTIHMLPKAGLILFFFIDAYLIGLTIHKLPKTGLTLFFLFIFPLGLNFDGQFFKFSFLLIWTYSQLPVLQIFIFSSDLPLIASFSNFHFFIHLDLPLITSFLNFHFSYLDLPLIARLVGIRDSLKVFDFD